MSMDRSRWIGLGAGLLLAMTAAEARSQIPWDETRWTIEADESRVERYEGREALHLRNGRAWLDDARLRNGTIQFDLYANDSLGFHGVAFRAVDGDDYEHFYLRPFVSGEPDASQYTPVFGGVSGWQIYSGPGFAGAVPIRTDSWVHVELRLRDGRAEAWVDGVPLVFPELQRATAEGRMALTSSGASARFANVVVSTEAPTLEAEPAASEEADIEGLVSRWRVSTPFPESRVGSAEPLTPASSADLEWDVLATDVRGVANLARLRTRSPPDNTVFAAVTLRASEAGPVRVRFGFSDRVSVYLDGRPLYRGSDGWRSRDYKFLGTVGLFDELVLPLEAGDNEVWLAVSEDFGGWGVTMQLVDGAGVEVVGAR